MPGTFLGESKSCPEPCQTEALKYPINKLSDWSQFLKLTPTAVKKGFLESWDMNPPSCGGSSRCSVAGLPRRITSLPKSKVWPLTGPFGSTPGAKGVVASLLDMCLTRWPAVTHNGIGNGSRDLFFLGWFRMYGNPMPRDCRLGPHILQYRVRYRKARDREDNCTSMYKYEYTEYVQ